LNYRPTFEPFKKNIFRLKINFSKCDVQQVYVFIDILGLFGIVVAITVQSAFRLKIHQDDIFFILKKSFLISAHQNDLKTLKNY